MDAETVMQKHADKHEWTDADQLAFALEYIQRQGDNAAFDEFLAEQPV